MNLLLLLGMVCLNLSPKVNYNEVLLGLLLN